LPLVRPCHPGAETAPLRENHLSRHFGAFHRKAISPRLGLAAEGRAPHAREERLRLTGACALLATGSSSTHRLQMECPGIRGASQRGRTECVPPRKPPARHPGFPPLGHLTLDSPSPRRGGLRTPARKALRLTEACILLATGRSFTPDHHAIPGHASAPFFAGAETAPLRENHLSGHFRPFPGRRPALQLAPPAEGRALHARKEDTGLTRAYPR
jgi:hypothetical protein